MPSPIRDQFRAIVSEQVAPAFGAAIPFREQRATLDAIGADAVLPEGTYIEPTTLAGRPAEWITAPGSSRDRVLLHLHGGGYVLGSCTSHHALSAWLGVSARMRVVIPEYRLAPEHPCPAALDDAVAAYRALLDQGIEPSRIGVVGDSAGGGLALAALQALRDTKVPMPGALVLISPWVDMTFGGESYRTRADLDPWLARPLLEGFSAAYRGEVRPEDPRVSPLFGSFEGLPPVLVQVGDQEILLSDATRLAERTEAAGVDTTLEVAAELWHVWHLFAPALPDAVEALERVGEFLRGTLEL